MNDIDTAPSSITAGDALRIVLGCCPGYEGEESLSCNTVLDRRGDRSISNAGAGHVRLLEMLPGELQQHSQGDAVHLHNAHRTSSAVTSYAIWQSPLGLRGKNSLGC